MESFAHPQTVMIVTASARRPAHELLVRVRGTYPRSDVRVVSREEAPERLSGLGVRDRLIVCHDAERSDLERTLRLLHFGCLTVPALVLAPATKQEELKTLSMELGVPCIPADSSTAALASAFVWAYAARSGPPDPSKLTPQGRELLEASFAVVSPFLTVLDTNERFARLLDTTRSGLVGKPVTSFLSAEGATRFVRGTKSVGGDDFVTDLVTALGDRKRAVVRRKPLFRESLLVGSLCTFSDISDYDNLLVDLHRDARRIAAAKNELEMTLDAIADPIVVVDEQSRVRRTNRAFAKRVGMPFEKIIGEPCEALLTPSRQVWSQLQMSGAAGATSLQASNVPLGGLEGVFNINCFPSRQPDGSPAGWVHLMREVEGEDREKPEDLSVSAAVKDVSHQIANHLTAIIGLAHLAALCRDMPTSAMKDIERIVQETRQAATLSRRLAVGKLQKGSPRDGKP